MPAGGFAKDQEAFIDWSQHMRHRRAAQSPKFEVFCFFFEQKDRLFFSTQQRRSNSPSHHVCHGNNCMMHLTEYTVEVARGLVRVGYHSGPKRRDESPVNWGKLASEVRVVGTS